MVQGNISGTVYFLFPSVDNHLQMLKYGRVMQLVVGHQYRLDCVRTFMEHARRNVQALVIATVVRIPRMCSVLLLLGGKSGNGKHVYC